MRKVGRQGVLIIRELGWYGPSQPVGHWLNKLQHLTMREYYAAILKNSMDPGVAVHTVVPALEGQS